MDSLLSILPYIQMVLAVILIGSILMQQRGAGLGGAFGGGEGTVHYERRGFEKTLFKGTILVAIIFVAASALPLFTTPVTPTMVPTTTEETSILDNVTIETSDGEVTTVGSESTSVESVPAEDAVEAPVE